MKWTIEEEKRGDTVTGIVASTMTPEGFNLDLRMPLSQRGLLEQIVTACNAHDQLVTALKLVNEYAGNEVAGYLVRLPPNFKTLDKIINEALTAAGPK